MSIDLTLPRCDWCLHSFEEYIFYHDREWGVPVHEDRVHFEFLILEGAQAGLSWSTILKRRDGYRRAFSGFDPEKVASYGDKEIAGLLNDTGIIRNRQKINSAVNNARQFLKVQVEFGSFDQYIWQFVDGKPVVNSWNNLDQIPARSSLSDKLSKDLVSRGFKFTGSTIMYAHLQATGLVNDHLTGCFRYKELTA
jgi:DNA-3-methyladenine glycosylase I